jgi:hypothetical protein
MADTPKLIQCGDHKMAPWSVVCIHLLDGISEEWLRQPGEDGDQDDWLCPSCAAKGAEQVPVEELKAVCIHCVRELQARSW